MKKENQKTILRAALKNGWVSNNQANLLVKSASGDRRLREIREKPPEGYKMIERPKKNCKCKEFMLVEV